MGRFLSADSARRAASVIHLAELQPASLDSTRMASQQQGRSGDWLPSPLHLGTNDLSATEIAKRVLVSVKPLEPREPGRGAVLVIG